MRWRRAILVSLVAGIVATYAVAWCCALWSAENTDTRWDSTLHQGHPPPRWPADVPAGWLVDPRPEKAGRLRADFEELGGFGLARGKCAVGHMYPEGGPVFEHWLVYWRAGWPMKALECGATQAYATPLPPMCGGVPAPAWLRPIDRTTIWDMVLEGPYLSLLPRWPGFLVDTALYGVAALALVFGWGLVRSAVRRGGCRCTKCGYDRRGLAVGVKCPECGTVPAPASK